MEFVNTKTIFKTTTRKSGELALQQTEARTLKLQALAQVQELLSQAYDLEIIQTGDGLIMLVPNEELGVIPMALDIKVKSLDYDYETAQQEYQQKQQAKQKKQETK